MLLLLHGLDSTYDYNVGDFIRGNFGPSFFAVQEKDQFFDFLNTTVAENIFYESLYF